MHIALLNIIWDNTKIYKVKKAITGRSMRSIVLVFINFVINTKNKVLEIPINYVLFIILVSIVSIKEKLLP